LLVLLPGETLAPGTATGKTGTPTKQLVGANFDIVVYAVDDTFHRPVLAPNDQIAITSSDATAALPANNSLSGGTRTFSVACWAEGSFTFTATDVTDDKKGASTSSEIAISNTP
jgi:hypothetical protein